MLWTEARLETPNAEKYLAQLSKHFAHKVPVEAEPDSARFALPTGPAVVAAGEGALHLRAEAQDAAGIDRARHILESHLLRFAFREASGPLAWSEPASA